jgi:hypothetical protein
MERWFCRTSFGMAPGTSTAARKAELAPLMTENEDEFLS